MAVLNETQLGLLTATTARVLAQIRCSGDAAPLVVVCGKAETDIEVFEVLGTPADGPRQFFALGVYARGAGASAVIHAADAVAAPANEEGLAPRDNPAHMQCVIGCILVKDYGLYPYQLESPYFRGEFNEILPAGSNWSESDTGLFQFDWSDGQIRPGRGGVIDCLQQGFTTDDYQPPSLGLLAGLGCHVLPSETVLDALSYLTDKED